ncbi:MAG TPA: hypothetical protein VJX67_03500 [Blastocatellia bacterium]|nr:hypothetical protein [Blastocatellia bacterium]
MADNPFPSFLDFEASSLSDRSYPIEVAWSMEDGSIESHLISPATILEWDDWDPEAEKVHRLSRVEIVRNGERPTWVSARMNERLSGKTVYTDAPAFDGFWLSRLFTGSGGGEPGFDLANAENLIVQAIAICDGIAVRAEARVRIEAMKLEARRRCPGRHRAAWDVQYLVELWKLAKWSTR